MRPCVRRYLGFAAILFAGLIAPAQALATPSQPTLVGSVTDSTDLAGALSVAVSGNYAYTTAYSAGMLTAVNISNPASPFVSGSTASTVPLTAGVTVSIAGGYAFVVSKNRNVSAPTNPADCTTGNNNDGSGNSLTIVDIHTNPALPSVVGTITDTNHLFGAYGIAVSGNYAFVAYQGVLQGQPCAPLTSGGGLSVIDISNPAGPQIVANIDNGSLPSPWTGKNLFQHSTAVKISGTVAWVTSFYSARLTAVDISNPTSPKILGSLGDWTDIPYNNDVAIQGNYAYLADQTGATSRQFAVVDISNPKAPKAVSSITNPALYGAYRVRVRGNFAYVSASSTASVVAIDISNPSSPRVAGTLKDLAHLNSASGLDLDSTGRYLIANSPKLSTDATATYPPYAGQPGGPVNHGTISVIDLIPSPISVSIAPASEPPNPTTQTAANFTFSVSDAVSTTLCWLDGGVAAPCTTPTSQTYSSLGVGTHTFTVQATDAIGNTATDSYTWVVGTAPQNLLGPTIAGSPAVGAPLTASPGSWSGTPAPTFSYQWQQCDSGGLNCAPVGTNSSTYSPTSGDVGDTIEVVVTASNGLGSPSATSGPTAVVPQSVSGPSNTSPPGISGTAAQGQTLTASPGTWTGSPTFGYQWLRCDQSGQNCAQVGAGGTSYPLSQNDVGATIELTVTASNSAGSVSLTTPATAIVTGPPSNGGTPGITGNATLGGVLAASPGTWSGYPAPSLAYQWLRCTQSGCPAISGATGSTYTAARADVGATVEVKVTATNASGTASSTSTASAIVTGSPSLVSAPTITGTLAAGNTVTATNGLWSGYPRPTYVVKWQRCPSPTQDCTTIVTGGSTYTLTSADVGSTLRVIVTASNTLGSAPAASSRTAVVAPAGGKVGGATMHTTLAGVSADRPKLQVTVSTPGSAVSKLVIGLPRGLTFASSKQIGRHSITVLGPHGTHLAFTLRAKGRTLQIVLATPAQRFTVRIGSRAIIVAPALMASVRNGHRAALHITVRIGH